MGHIYRLRLTSVQWALGCFALPWALLNFAVQVKYVGVTPTLTCRNQGHKCLLTAWCSSADAGGAWKSLAAQLWPIICCLPVQRFPPFFLPILSYSAHTDVVPEELQDDGVSTIGSSTSVIEKD